VNDILLVCVSSVILPFSIVKMLWPLQPNVPANVNLLRLQIRRCALSTQLTIAFQMLCLKPHVACEVILVHSIQLKIALILPSGL
jgi:hypothetical protein